MRLMDSPACVVGENSQAMQIIRRHKPNNDIAECLDSVSCTTFNILAPVYKRLNSESCRESQFREYWKKRNEAILEMLLKKKSSIICLQELWVGNGELVEMYERNLNSHGYDIYQLRRTNNCEDGLLTAIRKDHFQVLSCRELLFNDSGDRVAQLPHIKSATSFRRSQTKCIQQETLVVNTHLMFPHCSDVCLLRLRQVYKILEYLETYKAENKLPPMSILLCRDWNGSKRGHVYKFLRCQGFLSSYDTARRYTDSDADAHKVHHSVVRAIYNGSDFGESVSAGKENVGIVLESTGFYAEQGGQICFVELQLLRQEASKSFGKADSLEEQLKSASKLEALSLEKAAIFLAWWFQKTM